MSPTMVVPCCGLEPSSSNPPNSARVWCDGYNPMRTRQFGTQLNVPINTPVTIDASRFARNLHVARERSVSRHCRVPRNLRYETGSTSRRRSAPAARDRYARTQKNGLLLGVVYDSSSMASSRVYMQK